MRAGVNGLSKSCLGVVLLLLGGCVYDPYIGGWVPCCSYGYGYGYGYRYPPPYYPPPYYAPGSYGSPYGAPGPGQGYPYSAQGREPQQEYPSAPGAVAPGNGGRLAQRFALANVAHDGRLTREQAEQGMPFVARNFDAIDIDRKGYVTLPEIGAFAAQRQAAGGGQPWQPGEEE